MEFEQAFQVSVKPPQFTEQEAAGWFAIVEAQFALAKITVSSTRFYQCLSSLPAALVSRLPMEILAGKDYDSLKDAVLHLVESSKPELFESLLQPEQLVGKPSSCLSVLQRTAAKVGVGEEFVRHKFISSLPANITPVLAASSTKSLAQLGILADNLVAFSKCNPVSHVQKHEFPSSSNAPNRHRPSFNSGAGVRPFHESQRPKICLLYTSPSPRD